MTLTYGKLRSLIESEQLGWQPPVDPPDYVRVPLYPLGATDDGLLPTADAPGLDFHSLGVGNNPFLAVRRAERRLVSVRAVQKMHSDPLLRRLGLDDVVDALAASAPEVGGAPSRAVDWRNRWGANWVTSTRDQNPCNACWAFAGTALVESMVRIEHALWVRLSEGDVHRGVGKTCPDLGNMGEVSGFFSSHGICDPGSWPWRTDAPPYVPTPDRGGRSVRGPAFDLVSVADSKGWIDTVGPLVSYLEVYDDLGAIGSTVYRHSTDKSNALRGGHFLLIIGYSDTLDAWLCKNSWGSGWGVNGVGWIAYGECKIDDYARYGVRNTNPDPWTKRRLHNGNLYESGNGALHRNLEVTSSNGKRVKHRWRDGTSLKWSAASKFASDAAGSPTLIGTTYDRNMEAVYTTAGGRLHHWWTGGGGDGPWNDGGVFGPSGCTGTPGFVQSDHNAPGNFEVVVSVGTRLQHLWRDGAGWHDGPLFGSRILSSGATLVQGSYGTPHGNLELVALRTDGTMQHFWRSSSSFAWSAGPVFGSSVTSPPVMIQGQYGMRDELGPHGNFELCAVVGGRAQHWWRWNAAGGDGGWRYGGDFGHDVLAVAGICQGSWGMNLEVVLLRSDRRLQHYWRDGSGWHEGPVIGAA